MKPILLRCSLTLILAGRMLLAADTTGLYDLRDESHPRPLPDRIERATLRSVSNDNQSYFLALHASPSFSLRCSQIGLVVGNKTIRFNSEGPDSIETTINDPGAIPRIIELFRPEVFRRHHPGHRMLVQFLADKIVFKVGEPVTAKLRITNVGNTDFTFIQGGRQRRATRDNQFAFTADLDGREVLSDSGDPHNEGGIGVPITLEPDKTWERSVDLSKWFTFRTAGTYLLRGSYYMEFVDSLPQELNIIWEDCACAEFTLEIKG